MRKWALIFNAFVVFSQFGHQSFLKIEILPNLAMVFKLRQRASIAPNVGLSVGPSKKICPSKINLRGFVDNTNIYHCWGVL